MRILLTNDDGIHAAGLKLLELIAGELSDDVTIVAPENDQSGVAHSLSLSDPLRLREIGPRHFALKGTPTDCVIMGVRKIMADHPPDLVLSGVNRGQNVAEDVTYSGTIAGAMEGALLGHSLDRPVAGLWRSGRTAKNRMGGDGNACRAGHSHDSGRGHRSGRPRQRQLSRLPSVRGGRHRAHPPGPTQHRIDAGRGAARRPRLSVLSGSCSSAALTSRRREPTLRRSRPRRFRSPRSGSISPIMIRVCDLKRLLPNVDAMETTSAG